MNKDRFFASHLHFIKDYLEKFGKSIVLVIEEKKSTLQVLKENEGIKEQKYK